MSNIFPPKLMPILEPLPEINEIQPLNLISFHIPKYPPMKTPKLQDLQNETITYPLLRSQPEIPTIIYPAKQAIGNTEIVKEIRKIKPKRIRKAIKIPEKKIYKPRSRGNDLYIIILYIILIILIYYVLQLIF